MILSKDQFKAQMRDIVVGAFPTERTAFNLSADDLINRLYSDAAFVDRAARPQGEFGFLEEGKSVLEFVIVVHSTYKVIRDLAGVDSTRAGHLPSSDIFCDIWKTALIESGIVLEKASEIVNRFAQSLYARLRT